MTFQMGLKSWWMGVALLASVSVAAATPLWKTLPEPQPLPPAKHSGYAAVNGIKMYYAEYGAGEPLLLIHGGLGYADVWGAQVRDLARDHRVIVAESRGHGRTTRNEAPFSYTLMADDYLALLDTLKIDKVTIVGWSDGGIIGLDLAQRHPERLNKVWAHAANSSVDGVNPKVMEDKTFGRYITKAGKMYAKRSPTPKGYDDFLAQIGKMWETQPQWTAADLKKIHTPVAIVAGDHDEAILPAHTQFLADTIPGAKLVILKNVSHFAMLQDPKAYNAALRAFLKD